MVRVSWGTYLYDGPHLDCLVVKLHAFTAFSTTLLQFSTGVPSRLLRWLPTGHIADLETPFRIPAGCHPEQIGTNTHTYTHVHL